MYADLKHWFCIDIGTVIIADIVLCFDCMIKKNCLICFALRLQYLNLILLTTVCLFRFGDALPADGLSGWVVKADPLHGCSPIKPPPADVELPPGYYWIAIIQRSVPGSPYECTFQVHLISVADPDGFLKRPYPDPVYKKFAGNFFMTIY
jgi:hypothetical protein